ncbi:N-acetylmuramoyl-L-alanine amidase [Desulfosporosinus youngiae]|uniref:Negative regulator of beta-lactamase expression n=1 Tax=Desulfosporosinus youngiae DSM 17734 TaxID=768710 RepID=H5XWW5_9FIRM|nr:N-acetylmuramoyl-L-alanine amidase [Desulfosporosinus youngiae]EHQ90764.1 negative regulator of beta-lactamase expression [Desulfosporosinus youngiae DSM 17734]
MKDDKDFEKNGSSDVSRRDFFGKVAKTTVAGVLMAATGGILTNPKIAIADGNYSWSSNNPKPIILSRSAWGATPPKTTLPARNTSNSYNLIFHHSGSLVFQLTDFQACILKVNSIQSQQMSSGWDDIAYHYLIDPAGRIYDGRDPSKLGGHCTGKNDDIGICLLGNYDSQSLTSAQITAIQALSAWRIRIQGIWKTNTFGHKDFLSTECPGENLESYVTNSLRTYLSSAIY